MPSPCHLAALRADELDDLLAKLPAADRETAAAVCADLLKLDKPVAKLAGLLDGKQDAAARRAIHGLAVHVARPGASKERESFAKALAEQVELQRTTPNKMFLLQQLQYCGGPEVVPAIAKALPVEGLTNSAAQVLARIGGDKSTAALRDALPAAKGKGKVAIVQALGKLRDPQAAVPLTKLSGDKEDRDLHLAVLDALAQIANEASVDTFLSALPGKPSLERGKTLNACLVYAERLAETGQAKVAQNYLGRLKAAVKNEKDTALVQRTQDRLFGKKGKDQ